LTENVYLSVLSMTTFEAGIHWLNFAKIDLFYKHFVSVSQNNNLKKAKK